jgi:hypothetical protein
MEDAIVKDVIDKFKLRSESGIKKYGTTLEKNQLTENEWLLHLQEELMDAVLYIQKRVSVSPGQPAVRVLPLNPDLIASIYRDKLPLSAYFNRKQENMNNKMALRCIMYRDMEFTFSRIAEFEYKIYGVRPHHTTIMNSLGKEKLVAKTINAIKHEYNIR